MILQPEASQNDVAKSGPSVSGEASLEGVSKQGAAITPTTEHCP